MSQASPRLLPPRPLVSDWALAGASAGLLLGLAELAIVALRQGFLPPRLASVLIATDALAVAGGAWIVGAILARRGARSTHSSMVSVVAAVALAVAAVSSLAVPGGHGAIEVLALGAGVALAVLVGTAGHALGVRLENGGRALPGPLVWGATGLCIAASGGLAGTPLLGGNLTVALLPFLLAGAVVLVFELAGRSRGGRSWSARSVLVSCAVAAVLASAWPVLVPWALLEPQTEAYSDAPASLLLLAVSEPRVAPGEESPTRIAMDRLAADGVRYDHLLTGGRTEARALLHLPHGERIVPMLQNQGYATAAVVRDLRLLPDPAIVEVDAEPGPRRLLEEAHWTTAAPLLLGPGAPLLGPLGLAGRERSAAEATRRARRWLIEWRARRAPAPFFLYLDLRTLEGPDPPDAPDAGVGALIEDLSKLEIDGRTWVLALIDPAQAGVPARLVVRPPLAISGQRIDRARAAEITSVVFGQLPGETDPFRLPGLRTAPVRGGADPRPRRRRRRGSPGCRGRGRRGAARRAGRS